MLKKIIILLSFAISLNILSQNEITTEKLIGCWVQTESGFWKNDSIYLINNLGMLNGVYDGLCFDKDSVEFLHGLDRFDLLYSSKEYDLRKNSDFIWNNRKCKYYIEGSNLFVVRILFNDTSKIIIKKNKNDTLIIKKGNYSESFIKKYYNFDSIIAFRKITIIDDGIGEVIRPAYVMEIFDNRTLKLFTDESRIFEKGTYMAKIPKNNFDLLLKYFSFLNLNVINNKMFDGENSESTPTTIVIELKDNQKIFVRSNGYYEPHEFRWFLRLLYSLYYKLDCTRIN
ncbi:MAG: hypothetical protein J0M37_13590 [Ignavibacteria bacterium]|nr:hypothetical protein [Ignavibacteria bacterium]